MSVAPTPTGLPVLPPPEQPELETSAPTPAGPTGPRNSTGMLVAFFAVIGFVAIVTGALALITRSDTADLAADDVPEESVLDSADDFSFDDSEAIPFDGSPFDDLPEGSPFDDFPEGSPLDGLPEGSPLEGAPSGGGEGQPGEGQPGSPPLGGDAASQLLNELQQRFNAGQSIPLDQLGAPGITAQQQLNGITTLTGPDGQQLHIVPEGTPAGDVPEGLRERALKPSPNGEFGGVEVDENGQLVPVPRGEETENTLRFEFGERGVSGLDPSAVDGSGLNIDPARPGSFGEGVSPSDSLQEQLEADGRSQLDIAGREVTIERLPNGIYRLTTPEGDELLFDPYSTSRGGGSGDVAPELLDDSLFAPSIDGPYSGFRIDENGEFVPVPRGEETDDMFNFGFNAEGGTDELFLPGQQEPVEIPSTQSRSPFGGGLGLRPDQATPGIDLAPPPASGDVLSPDQLRAEIQDRFDAGTATPITPDDQSGITVRELPDGTVELRGPDGVPLYLVPEGVPGSGVPDSQRGRALKPVPGSEISGVEVDENGRLVPVPAGEETENTLRFEFGEGGVVGLDPADPDAPSITITPDRSRGDGGSGDRPDVARDQSQSELEEQGETALDFGGTPVEVEQLENGDLRFTAPNGEVIEIDPDGASSGSSPGVGTDGLVVPSPDSIGGLELTPGGALEPVPADQLDDDSLRFEFDENGDVDGFELPDPSTGSLDVPELEEEEAPEPLGSELDVEAEEADPAFAHRNSSSILGLALIAIGVIVLGIAVGLLIRRRSSNEEPVNPDAEHLDPEAAIAAEAARQEQLRQQQLVNQTVESLSDQLRREPDPRQAVLRAYAVIEAGIGGVSRRSAESHTSYLHRALGNNAQHHQALTQLTDLFELARYSDYPITEDMRNAAITSLESIRNAPAEPAPVAALSAP